MNEGPDNIIVILGLCFLLIDWLSFEEEGGGGAGGVSLELDVQGQGGGRILDVDGQEDRFFLKIGKFSWTSYVYHPQTVSGGFFATR